MAALANVTILGRTNIGKLTIVFGQALSVGPTGGHVPKETTGFGWILVAFVGAATGGGTGCNINPNSQASLTTDPNPGDLFIDHNSGTASHYFLAFGYTA